MSRGRERYREVFTYLKYKRLFWKIFRSYGLDFVKKGTIIEKKNSFFLLLIDFYFVIYSHILILYLLVVSNYEPRVFGANYMLMKTNHIHLDDLFRQNQRLFGRAISQGISASPDHPSKVDGATFTF